MSQNETELSEATIVLKHGRRVKIGPRENNGLSWKLEHPYGEKLTEEPLPIQDGTRNATFSDISYYAPSNTVYRYYLTVRPTEELSPISNHRHDTKYLEIIEDDVNRHRMRFTRLQFPKLPDKLYLTKRYESQTEIPLEEAIRNYYERLQTALTPKELVRRK